MGNNRFLFLFFGIVMLINAILFNGAFIVQGKFPEHLMAIALTIMAFCLAYLSPHFAAKDERAQKIRERAVYISYFWGISFAIGLMIVVNPTFGISLAAYHVLTLFMTLYISTVFLNMVYYARKY